MILRYGCPADDPHSGLASGPDRLALVSYAGSEWNSLANLRTDGIHNRVDVLKTWQQI